MDYPSHSNSLSLSTLLLPPIEITDGNGCSWPLDSPDISIEVLQQRPAVSFGCSSSDTSIGKPIYFLDGDAARLPISYSGRAPFTLEYKSADGSKIVLENIKPGSSRGSGGGGGGASILEVRQPGSYELLSFRDAHCAGIVVEPRHCSAAIVDKPTISLVGGGGGGEDDDTSSPFVRVAPPICEGTPASIELEFTGKSPFKYQYRREITRTAAVAVTETNDIEEAVGGRVGKINIDTQLAGWFVYTVTKLGDDNYRLFDVIAGGSQDKKKGKIVVKQLVNARPDARILGGPDIVFGCMGEPPLNFDIGGISSRSEEDEAAAGEKDKENVVLIEFKGQAPFDAVLELRHESQQKQVLRLRNITESLYKFTPPTTLSATGKYTLQLVSVVDQTGCGRDFEKEVAAGDAASGALGSTSISTSGKSFGATIINIHVSDVARISPIHAPSGVCIGDMLSYALQGTPPFSILYSYNDVIQPEIVVHDPLISLFAGAAGTLAIKQVCNSAMCCTRPVDLQTVIWDIPKAAIDGGVDVEEDIREGDETVINIDFIGVPPFSFTYSRTPIYAATDNHVDGNPEESYTISGIQESSVKRDREVGGVRWFG